MAKYNGSENTYIKALYAPGFSSLTMSYFRIYLTLNFVPWLSTDSTGHSQYCKKTFLSTTLDYNWAAYFHGACMSILSDEGSTKSVEATLPCKNNAALTLLYRPGEDNQMTAYMVINKDNKTILFRFETRVKQEIVDGQMVTKVIQAGLETFSMVLKGYMESKAPPAPAWRS